MEKTKSFYVISALLPDSSSLGYLKRHGKYDEAVKHAKEVINKRHHNGDRTIEFFVLKVVAQVSPAIAPVRVMKLK